MSKATEITDVADKKLVDSIMDRVEDAVVDYVLSFKNSSPDGKTLPTINQIEDYLTELTSSTREIFLDMASKSISNFDESKAVAAKKENSKKRG